MYTVAYLIFDQIEYMGMYLQAKDNIYATLFKYDWLRVTLSSIDHARVLADTRLVLSSQDI
jgi:hypothetical protein